VVVLVQRDKADVVFVAFALSECGFLKKRGANEQACSDRRQGQRLVLQRVLQGFQQDVHRLWFAKPAMGDGVFWHSVLSGMFGKT
jgi:hypothetical protein